MDYNFLLDANLVGQKFYNPNEYKSQGIVYTITDMDDKFMDLEWVNPTGNRETSTGNISINNFINNLNDGFFILVLDDDYDSFIDDIKWW